MARSVKTPRTLLTYQQRWVRDGAGLKVFEKSRRIGASWAEAYDAVMHAAGGAGNVYYQSYSKDMTRGFIDDCADWARSLELGAAVVGETILRDGDRDIQAFSIKFASEREIVAMTSAPRAFRSKGRPGDLAIIDEAAFVDDLGEVLKAAMAFRMWGGRVHVISTHRGEASPFAALVRDVREGVQPGSIHKCTFRQAIEEGLYKRICKVTGREWSPEAEAEWEKRIRAEYGHNAAEELDCVPAAGSGSWLPWEVIRAAENADAGIADRYAGGRAFVGVDVARRADLWVAAVVEVVGDVLWLREMRAERNIHFSEQRQIVAGLVDRYRPVRVAVDQTGMGEGLVEDLQDDHGRRRVEGVLMTGPAKLDIATALREAMEDGRLRIPADEELRADLHAVRVEAGPTGAERLVAERNAAGHADRFWALALAVAASAGAAGPFEGEVAGRRSSADAFGTPFGFSGPPGKEIDVELGLVLSPEAQEMGRYV